MSAGEDFCYEEAAQAHNWASAGFTAWATALLLAVMFSRRLHGLVSKLAPQPGTGEGLKCDLSGANEACKSTAVWRSS